MNSNIFLIQAEKMGKLLEKYWSVEIFWFPFNSIVNRMLSMLPKGVDDSKLTLSPELLFASHPLSTVRQ